MDTLEALAVIVVEDDVSTRDGCDPEAAVLLYAGSRAPGEDVAERARGDARGVVLKSSPAAHLIDALRCVAAGGRYLDPALVALLSGGAELPRLSRLSPREHEILGLLSEGLTGQAIARRLFLSPETVRTHVRNATTKLGAKTRVQAVALLVRSRGPGALPAAL